MSAYFQSNVEDAYRHVIGSASCGKIICVFSLAPSFSLLPFFSRVSRPLRYKYERVDWLDLRALVFTNQHTVTLVDTDISASQRPFLQTQADSWGLSACCHPQFDTSRNLRRVLSMTFDAQSALSPLS